MDYSVSHQAHDHGNLIEATLVKNVITLGRGSVSKAVVSGRVETLAKIVEALPKGTNPILQTARPTGWQEMIYSKNAEGVLYVMARGTPDAVTITIWGTRREEVQTTSWAMEKIILPPEKHLVQLLTKRNETIELYQLNNRIDPLVRTNYSEDVLVAFDRIVADIKEEKPRGRIAILHGEPGTGKTNLIKAIMEATHDTQHVIVPADVLPDLAGPDFVRALIEGKDDEKRMVLTVEDADSCLTRRTEDTQADIANVLNLADGIIGSLLDVYIIATTNQKEIDIDKALLRPGRLSVMASVGALSASEANTAFMRLTGRPGPFDRETTLAEVYAKAR